MSEKIKNTEQEEQVFAENGTDAPVKEKKRSSIGTRIAKYATALVVALVLFWFGFTTVVKEGNCAVILRFGAVREEITEPGLYFKLPWPFENTVTYDSRLQYLESNLIQVVTADSSPIVITSYMAWEIADPVLYHNRVGMQEGGAATFIKDQVDDATNLTAGGYLLSNFVSLETEGENRVLLDQIQQEVFDRMVETCRQSYGIELKDLGFLRLSFPASNLTDVFETMRNARKTQINQILTEANYVASGITEQAKQEAEHTKGEGKIDAANTTKETEKLVAEIHAAAYANGQELYKFLQQLDTIVASVNGDTMMIININDPPFNVLTKYAESMTLEGDKTVIQDLEYMLSQMSEEDQQTLVAGIRELLENYDPVEVGG